jgi:hypothetical protein
MVTQYAKNCLDKLMTICLDETFRSSAGEVLAIKPMDRIDSVVQKEFIMLTISSYEFRICILLHFSKDKPTMDYVAKALKITPDKLEVARYYDFLCEMGNTFCGTFKRELGKHFPHLGMSTPNRLVGSSLKFMRELNFDYDAHFKTSANDNVAFCSSVFISAYKDFDLCVEIKKQAEADAENGALELF